MRIGVMARTIDAKDGPGVYTRNLLDHLLEIDRTNEYVLFYKSREYLGRYAAVPNATEVLVPTSSKLLWDQLSIPYHVRKRKIDLLFHPKFTVPFLTTVPTVMCIRGSEWFIYPEFYNKLDILYIRTVMPWYCRKATRIISNSNTITRDFERYLGIDGSKVTTIYNAHNPEFRRITDGTLLDEARRRYGLTTPFVLTVTRAFHTGVSGTYSGKNVVNLIEGFHASRCASTHRLVVVGHRIDDYLKRIGRADLAVSDRIDFPGYIPQPDLPAFYNLADCFLYPSFYESFTMPIVEAMACGCPVVTSKGGACPEQAQDAALYVEDPADVKSIADRLDAVALDRDLREQLSARGLRRAASFSYEKTARETLRVFDEARRLGKHGDARGASRRAS